jgi:hypothetical protein
MKPTSVDLERIAKAYRLQAGSNGPKKTLPPDLKAGPNFKYTIAQAAWYIQRLEKVCRC